MSTKKGYTKRFKIGEYAVGGIIQVDIHGKVIIISALDYFSKKIIVSGSVMANQRDTLWQLMKFLGDLTSTYYEGKIIDWIKSKVKLGNEFDVDSLI